MYRLLINISSVIITSFYFFPIEFVFLPGVNTKMAMAGIGLVILGKRLAQRGGALINKDFMILSVLALLISMASFVTMTINNTPDASFLTYFVSMWVWMGGAYTVVRWLDFCYGRINVQLISDYLIAVCVTQCILAYIMNQYTPLRDFVDSLLGGESFMGKAEGRLYGIGAALDVAGLRFAAVSVIIGFLLSKSNEYNNKRIFLYIVSFLVITVVGNMISRTTTMGVGIAMAYLLYSNTTFRSYIKNRKLWLWLGGILCIGLPSIVYFYNTNETFYINIRFAFEGFFSLWETGQWQVSSNDILFEHMIVFPDNIRTWLIGDGYAANPIVGPFADPYYTGPAFHGFYMATDIGYIRYIFYFGLIGTIIFISFMLKSALICMSRFKEYKMMFLMILLVNYIGWFKVSTDIFLVFAIFLVVSKEDEIKEGIIKYE